MNSGKDYSKMALEAAERFKTAVGFRYSEVTTDEEIEEYRSEFDNLVKERMDDLLHFIEISFSKIETVTDVYELLLLPFCHLRDKAFGDLKIERNTGNKLTIKSSGNLLIWTKK